MLTYDEVVAAITTGAGAVFGANYDWPMKKYIGWHAGAIWEYDATQISNPQNLWAPTDADKTSTRYIKGGDQPPHR